MPRNYPEIWVGRVEKLLSSAENAPWLDGVSEIASDVIEVGAGSLSEKNLIHIPTSEFEPTVLINNTTYPLALEEYTDDTITVSLDKYQTLPTSISDDQADGAAYDMIDGAVKTHPTSINKKKYAKAIHALAPNSHVDKKTPVIKTNGADDGTGRLIFTRSEITKLKKQFDDMQIPTEGRRLVLCSDHVADLLENDQKFRDQYYNFESGKITKMYGFEIYEYVENPHFNATTGQKCSFGAIPVEGTDFQASVAFYVPNVGKKTGGTKQYFADSKTQPEVQATTASYRHYFIVIPKLAMYIGAIISGKKQ